MACVIGLAGVSYAYTVFKKPAIDKSTPEGQFLELIALETDTSAKVALLERFVSMFPQFPEMGWVYEQMLPAYQDAAQWDKVVQIGEKIIAIDPDNIDAAYAIWQAADAKKDARLVKKWAAEMAGIAERLIGSPRPSDPEEALVWQRRVDFSRRFANSAEYDLYTKAVQAQDPRKKIELLDELIKTNPQTQYLERAQLIYFLTYKQLGDHSKALMAAEKVLERNRNYEDVIYFVADHYLRQKRDAAKVLELSNRLLELMPKRPKPPSTSEQQWADNRNLYLALAHYMTGVIRMDGQQFAAADESFQAALMLLKSGDLLSTVLNSLGWVNYKLERIQEAVKFYKMCMSVRGPFQAQAAKNLAGLEAEYKVQE
jgi:tetratricopeptide (TPR) repeat protein